MNESVQEYCWDEGIVLTRCRPYRKNDRDHIEQKNGAIVCQIVGYWRFEGMDSARMLAWLYATTRLIVNAFQPSFELAEKERDGARVRKRYDAPATPCNRLLADPRPSLEVCSRVGALCADLDPVWLLADTAVSAFSGCLPLPFTNPPPNSPAQPRPAVGRMRRRMLTAIGQRQKLKGPSRKLGEATPFIGDGNLQETQGAAFLNMIKGSRQAIVPPAIIKSALTPDYTRLISMQGRG